MDVMRCRVENALSTESLEVAHIIVDKKVRCHNAFVAAKHDVAGRDEGKVLLQPLELW